jgi:hypothetical protein
MRNIKVEAATKTKLRNWIPIKLRVRRMELHILTRLLWDRRWIDGGRWRSQKITLVILCMYTHPLLLLLLLLVLLRYCSLMTSQNWTVKRGLRFIS